MILKQFKKFKGASPVLPSACKLLHRSLCCGFLGRIRWDILMMRDFDDEVSWWWNITMMRYYDNEMLWQWEILMIRFYDEVFWWWGIMHLFHRILQKLRWAKCPPGQIACRSPANIQIFKNANIQIFKYVNVHINVPY